MKKRMGPGVVLFLGISGIFVFLFWLFISYKLIEYFSGNYTFEENHNYFLKIPAKYMVLIPVVMWFGGLFFIVDTFNEIKNWFKKR